MIRIFKFLYTKQNRFHYFGETQKRITPNS